ncbi:hypothetical protein HED60_11595 [Planctomycetales bacterium ZRK34]|nr:hypothetical protein HED60_11595 [Planctomycetales bacterium ZRK34]
MKMIHSATRPLVLTLLLTLIAPAVASAQDADTLDLRPMWTEGQTSRYRITQTELTIQQITGLTDAVESTVNLEAELTWTVTKASADGGGTAVMSLDKIWMKVTDPSGNSVEEDGRSGNEATASLRTWINAITNAPLTVSVESDGSIARVEGYRAIQSKAGEAGDNLDERYFREVAMDLAVLVGGQADARLGKAWTVDHDTSHRMGEIHFETTYKPTAVESIAGIDVVMIDRNSKMRFTPDLSDLPADAPKLNVRTVEASQSGQVLYDTSRHEIVGGHGEQTLALEISFTVGGRNITRTSREVTSSQIIRISEQ